MNVQQCDSPFAMFAGTGEPKAMGSARATGRRIVVRLNPYTDVDGDQVGVV